MSWIMPLARPITVADRDEPLRNVRDAVAYIEERSAFGREDQGWATLMLALALASLGKRDIVEVTDQLEAFINRRRLNDAVGPLVIEEKPKRQEVA